MSRARSPKSLTKRTGPQPVSTVKAELLAIPPSGEPRVGSALTTSPKGFLRNKRRSYRNKERVTAERILQYRMQGKNNGEIANMLGYSPHTISYLLYKAGQLGWFTTPDIEDHLTYNTSHKIVRNIDKGLDTELPPAVQEMTIAAAKGRGLFKHYEAGEQTTAVASLILGMKIEVMRDGQPMSPRQQPIELPRDTGGGTPAYSDGESHATEPA